MSCISPCRSSVLACAVAFTLGAQDPVQPQPEPSAVDLTGSWQGTLKAGPQSLELALHLKLNEGGEWGGTFDSLTQQALGIPISTVQWEGDLLVVKFAIGASFEGSLGDGAPLTLSGHWIQNGAKLPLTFTKVDEVKVAEQQRPQHPEPPYPYRAEDVAYSYAPNAGLDSFSPSASDTDGTVTIAGTLTLPEGEGPFPAALLITGSGPQDRDETLLGHKPFLVIAHHLTQMGLAVLRVDDRGTGASTGTFSGSTSADFAIDARAGLHYLSSREDIDHKRMGLIGHSEGGIIAPMVAASDDGGMVAFAILLAPPAVNIAEIVMHQQQLIGAVTGDSPEDLKATKKFMGAVFGGMRRGAKPAELDVIIREAAASIWDEISEQDRESLGAVDALEEQGHQLVEPWMSYLVTVDPADALSATKCPTLALFGGKDLQVDPGQNEAPLREAFARGGHIEPTVIVLADHNHLFQRSTTGSPMEYGTIEETFSQLTLDAMARWLRANVLR